MSTSEPHTWEDHDHCVLLFVWWGGATGGLLRWNGSISKRVCNVQLRLMWRVYYGGPPDLCVCVHSNASLCDLCAYGASKSVHPMCDITIGTGMSVWVQSGLLLVMVLISVCSFQHVRVRLLVNM
jgi:hypothetical protein